MRKQVILFSLVLMGFSGLFAKDVIVEDSETTDLHITNKSAVYFAFSEDVSSPDFNTKDEKGLKVIRKSDNEYIISFKTGGKYEKVEGIEKPALIKKLYSDKPSEIFFKGLESGYKYIFRLIPSENEGELIYKIVPKSAKNKIVVLGENTRIALQNSNENTVEYVNSGDIVEYVKYSDGVYTLKNGSTIHGDFAQRVSEDNCYKDTKRQKEIYAIERKNPYRQTLINLNKAVFEDDKSDIYKKYKKEEVNKIIFEDEELKIKHLLRKIGATYIQDIYEIIAQKDNVALNEKHLNDFKNLPPFNLKKRIISMKKNIVLNSGEKTLLAIVKER